MPTHLEVTEVSHALSALHRAIPNEHRHGSVVVVVPLGDERCETVEQFIEEGPPFDPAAVGLDSHQVYLTEREAVFVFETEEGASAFERILSEPEFWDVVGPWEHNLSGEPRVGHIVFDWHRRPGDVHSPDPHAS
jgi:hypothetical protein